MKIIIEQILPEHAATLCEQIAKDLPEYFGLPECNDHYIKGVRSRINFAAKTAEEMYVGLLSLDFPYPNTSSIYWMAVFAQWQGKNIGSMLIDKASQYAKKQKASTMTVETLSPQESDENYLETYHFYEKQGFQPLFNLKPEGYIWNMVYMVKYLY